MGVASLALENGHKKTAPLRGAVVGSRHLPVLLDALAVGQNVALRIDFYF